MCIFVFIGTIRDCYDITNNLIQSLQTSEGVTGLTDVVCAHCSNIITIFISSSRNLIITTQTPLSIVGIFAESERKSWET